MKNQSFPKRLGFALNGIRHALKSENSFRSQVMLAGGAIALLVALRPAPIWWALFALVIGGVLSAELFNTALEEIVDLLHPELHPTVARAKDCAAGAVLVLSVAALLIAAALLFDRYFLR